MRINIIVLFIFAFTFLTCNEEKIVTSISVDRAHIQNPEIEVFNIPFEISEVLASDTDSMTLSIDKEVILDLLIEQGHSYIYLKPGDQINMGEVNMSTSGIGIISEKSNENSYLEEFQKLSMMKMNDFIPSIETITKLPPDRFSAEIEKLNQPLKELVDRVIDDAEMSEYFREALQARYIAAITNDLSYYKGFYFSYHQEFPNIPSNFYQLIESSNMTSDSYLIFEESRQALAFYPTKDLTHTDYKSHIDFFKASIVHADGMYGKSLTGEFYNHDLILNIINYLSIDDAQEFITSFKNIATNKYLTEKLDQTIEPWLGLVAGNPAPNFKAFTRDNKEVALSDLRGKKIYIDVWATWCGPCLAEIPFLKEVEQELHGENVEFVSVSIDQAKDAGKWKDFVDKRQLQGTQLMAQGAWESDIVSSYNITGIPRFLLIDEEGKIINSNAPRPSEGTLKDILLN